MTINFFNITTQNNWRNVTIKKRKFFLIKFLLRKLALKHKYDLNTYKYWSLIVQALTKTFVLTSYSLQQNLKSFGKFLYKKIRIIQSFIKSLRFKITDLHNLKLLKFVSNLQFFNAWNSISMFTKGKNVDLFYIKLRESFLLNISNFNDFIQIKNDFGIYINFTEKSTKNFNFYVFQLYLKLYELEENLQWFNWRVFRSDIGVHKYLFYKEPVLVNFFKIVRAYGYQFWHKTQFKSVHTTGIKKFKLKKRWRFWREFKKCLLFDKSHIFIKFKWLHNHKRLFNHQFLESYSVAITSKLKQFYKKKTNRPRLFKFLTNIEYRLDILSIRVFKIRSLKWISILLYFGYITVNLKKKRRYYILQLDDLIFGWFLFKNYLFLFQLIKRLNKPKKLYNFLEFESFLNSFICLSFPIKNIYKNSSSDHLMCKKFIKYMYLKSY